MSLPNFREIKEIQIKAEGAAPVFFSPSMDENRAGHVLAMFRSCHKKVKSGVVSSGQRKGQRFHALQLHGPKYTIYS